MRVINRHHQLMQEERMKGERKRRKGKDWEKDRHAKLPLFMITDLELQWTGDKTSTHVKRRRVSKLCTLSISSFHYNTTYVTVGECV